MADPADTAASGTAATHTLVGRLTLPQAEGFLVEVSDPEKACDIVIDARGVDELPAAMVVVLTSLARMREETGNKLKVLSPSAAFVDAFSDLGLFQDLMKMEFSQ